MAEEDRLAALFKDRTIFLTGGSGFMGKIFLERLLRVTEVKKIILLIRHKKGIEPKERLISLVNDAAFDVAKKKLTVEQILSKLEVVTGDCEKLNLEMSEEDRKRVTENVTIFYHFAATIRFDEKMKKAVTMNVRGTREVIKLALECKKLEMFGHMSTAYCHLHVPFLLEKPYDPPADPHEIIKLIESMSDEDIEKNSEKILQRLQLPNTYCFSKSLAEALIIEARNKHKLPALIFRPSIVVSTWRDPVPGYIDNINGPIGLMIACGKGVVRTFYVDQKSYGDFLPCDIAINAIFVCTWNYLEYKNPEHYIIHFTSSQEVQLTWQQMVEIGFKILEKCPLNQILWFPNCTMTKYRWIHNIRFVIYHYIPAIIIDFFLGLFGYDKFMMKVQKRIEKGMEVVEYYANNQWDFDNRVQVLFRERLNDLEEDRYKVNSRGVLPEEFYEKGIYGARRYILKTPDSQIPAAQRVMKIMYVVDKIVKTFCYGGLSYWLFGLILSLFSGANVITTLIKIIFCICLFVL